MYYGFLAIINREEEGMLNVTFPDFPELMTCVEEKGNYTDEIKDCLALHIIGMEDECIDIPKGMSATEALAKHPLADDERILFISFDSDEERKNITVKYETVQVEIPVWLRLLAEEKNVKLNKALEKGLKEILGLNR